MSSNWTTALENWPITLSGHVTPLDEQIGLFKIVFEASLFLLQHASQSCRDRKQSRAHHLLHSGRELNVFAQRIQLFFFLIKIFSVEPSKHFKPSVFYIRAHSSFYPTKRVAPLRVWFVIVQITRTVLQPGFPFPECHPEHHPHPRVYVSGVFAGVPVSSRVSAKIQQLVNTLKQPRRPPLREFFVDDFDELLEG